MVNRLDWIQCHNNGNGEYGCMQFFFFLFFSFWFCFRCLIDIEISKTNMFLSMLFSSWCLIRTFCLLLISSSLLFFDGHWLIGTQTQTRNEKKYNELTLNEKNFWLIVNGLEFFAFFLLFSIFRCVISIKVIYKHTHRRK